MQRCPAARGHEFSTHPVPELHTQTLLELITRPATTASLQFTHQLPSEGRGAAHNLAHGSRSAETSALHSKDWDCSWKSREETSVQVIPAHGGRPRQGRYPTCRFCPGLEVVLLPYGFAKDF